METEISGAIRSAAAAVTLVQQALELAKKTRNAELVEMIADLRINLSEVKIGAANASELIAELQKDKQNLKQENEFLKTEIEALKKPPALELKKNGYYTSDNVGPYCPNCYDSDKVLTKMSDLGSLVKCSKCKYMKM